MVRSTSVSAVAVLDLHDQLLHLGVVTATQLREAGVEGAKLFDQGPAASPIQEQRVDEAQLLALWQFAANNTQLPHIGLLIGQTFNPATHGVLASWLRQCSRVSEALEVFQRHIALMNPSERWQYSETADALVLEIAFAPGKTYPQAAIERSMSAVLRWSREMTGVELRPLACEFAFPSPAYHARYVEMFGGELRFDSGRNSLHLPRDFLQYPILGASDYLRKMLESRARATLAQLQDAETLAGTVRRLIHASLPDRWLEHRANLPGVARQSHHALATPEGRGHQLQHAGGRGTSRVVCGADSPGTAGGDGQRAAGVQGYQHFPPSLQALVRPTSGSFSRLAMGLPLSGSMAR